MEGERKGLVELCGLNDLVLGRREGTILGEVVRLTGLLVGEAIVGISVGAFVKSPVQRT